MRKLLNELLSRRMQGEPLACCTVVATQGSTPQEAGAMMFVRSDGQQAGTLGGGCVEAEVRRRALASLAQNSDISEVHTFELDDDYGWDDGLICGGRMTILVEPMTASRDEFFRKLQQTINGGLGYTMVVALPQNSLQLPVGTRTIFDRDGKPIVSPSGGPELAGAIAGAAAKLRPTVANGFAVLPGRPRIRLIIVGAGHVGEAVANLAAATDFDVWVIDDREKYANSSRFPAADRIIVGDIGPTVQSLLPEIGPGAYCLIVTRGHSHDEEALFHLAKSDAGYIGMIGSKRKVRLTFEDLLARGISQEVLDRVYAPVGFQIGSQTVAEIAVSILAELIAVRSGSLRRTPAAGRQY